MQELRSTDILDKEILTDARKKAEKILKKADSDCAELIARVEADIAKAKAEKDEFFNKKLDAYEKDQKNSIPLEKQRFEVSFIQNAVAAEIDAYLQSLTEQQRLEIATKNFNFATETNFKAYVYGFELAEASKFLKNKLGNNLISCEMTVFRKMALEDDCGLSKPQGIILESEDKSFRGRLTLSEVCGALMNNNRKELADALFGGSL